MSLQEYSLSWSDGLIKRVETNLRDLHTALIQYYESKGYQTRVEDKKSSGEDGTESATTLDAVSPAGSFLLRTCVHPVPFSSMHHTQRGSAGADLVLTIPEAKCSLVDMQEGRYLQCRRAFLEEVERYLRRLISGAEKRVKASATAVQKDSDNDSDAQDDAEREAAGNAAAAARLERMELERVAMHGCYSASEKEVLRVHYRHRSNSVQYESFHVDLHIRPAFRAGRVTGSAALRKHPLYSYLILEDYLMPDYLKQLHEVCVSSHSLRRAIVILKCWAHHVGLTAASSGHSEGLNGFVVAAMVLRLLEEGIVTATMSDDNITRAVWVHMSRGFFTPAASTQAAAAANMPAAEKRGEVAVLRLRGDLMNVLFRTSAEFFRSVVQRAAEEALLFAHSAEVFKNLAFQPLQLRHDVALTVRMADGDATTTDDDDGLGSEVIKKSSVYFSPRATKVRKVLELLREALGVRASYVTGWQSSVDTVEVAIQLSSDAEGRNRLTRGPALEMTEAVAAFNTFWGKEITSTRQFPDGAVYRCVLWHFAEDSGTNTNLTLSASTVTRRVVEYAVRKHLSATAQVSVLLGSLEGFLAERVGAEWKDCAPLMHKGLLEASKAVQGIIADLPKAALPCKIVGFDVISESERHTAVFPVRPHLALTKQSDNLDADTYTGLNTAAVIEPIHCVMTIDDKHKIPDTPGAIAMMKGAICAQLAKTIQHRYGGSGGRAAPSSGGGDGSAGAKSLEGVSTLCTSHSVDIIFRGFLFRVYIAHYREVSLLRALQRDAEANMLEQKLFWSVQHAKFLRSVSFGHHSYANAVRLAKRWVSAMMLYEFVPPEAIELLVAYAYLGSNSVPKTPASGFLRFVQLLATYDWATPLVLPFTDEGQDMATAATLVRKLAEHQGLYIAAPYAPTESPFTAATPRPMIMHRLVQLAKGVVALLLRHMSDGGTSAEALVEAEVFHSSAVAFDFYMPFHPQLILQPDRVLQPDSTATAAVSPLGGSRHTPLTRIWQLDELEGEARRLYVTQLVEREPAAHAVRIVRAAVRDQGMVFYDTLAPRGVFVVGVTASPSLKQCQLMHSEVLRVARGAILPASGFPGVASSHGSAGAATAKNRGAAHAAAGKRSRPAKGVEGAAPPARAEGQKKCRVGGSSAKPKKSARTQAATTAG